jgi:uncharacterized membrane-anchored protein YhcB (DUF1043 family)
MSATIVWALVALVLGALACGVAWRWVEKQDGQWATAEEMRQLRADFTAFTAAVERRFAESDEALKRVDARTAVDANVRLPAGLRRGA